MYRQRKQDFAHCGYAPLKSAIITCEEFDQKKKEKKIQHFAESTHTNQYQVTIILVRCIQSVRWINTNKKETSNWLNSTHLEWKKNYNLIIDLISLSDTTTR